MFFRGFFGLIPILIGIVGGYVIALLLDLLIFLQVTAASWFAMPDFIVPFVSIHQHFHGNCLHYGSCCDCDFAEHIGHQMVLSKVVGSNFIEKPGLHRSIMGMELQL